MFNNPLRKYQSGGAAPSQEQQQMLAAFVEWLPKRVKEFANMAPEQIVETLNGMSQSPEGQKQVEQLMLQFKQELSGAQSSQFKKGGKIWNFICKHAKGGQIKDCGCKEDGGTVEKAQNGTSGIPQNASALDTYLMSNMQMPNSDKIFSGKDVAEIINGLHLTQPLVQAQEDGGKVQKEQKGSKWVSADKTIVIKNPGTSQADTTGTYSYPNRSGEFHFAPNGERTLTEWFSGDMVGQRYASPEWFKNHPYKNTLERMVGLGRKPLTPELEENARQRVTNRTKSQENGGIIDANSKPNWINRKKN